MLRPVTDLPVFLHPGFVKTATTSLQRNLFLHHSEIMYLGWPSPNPALKQAIRSIVYEDSETYSSEQTADPIRSFCSLPNKAKIIVLSHENCSLYEATDRGVVANRLATLFPQAQVLFTIRRQQDVLASWYLQKLRKYVKGNHFLPFRDWLNLKRKEPHKSILSNLDYSKTILNYARLFGRDRVRVMTFEMLIEDRLAFSALLAAWLGVDPEETARLLELPARNPTPTLAYPLFYRSLGRLLPPNISHFLGKHLLRLSLGRKLEVLLDADAEKFVALLCEEGNRRLEEEFGLDLRAYRYSVAGHPGPSNLASPRAAADVSSGGKSCGTLNESPNRTAQPPL